MAKDTTAVDAKKAAADLKAKEAEAKAKEAAKLAEKAAKEKAAAAEKAAKDAEKAKEKAAKDAEKAAAKAKADADAEAKKAAKAAEKAAEVAAKEAAKAEKIKEREAIKAQRAADREARKNQPRQPKAWEDLPAGGMQQAPREGSVLHTVLECIHKNKGATEAELQAVLPAKHEVRRLLRWANRERGYGFVMTKSTGKIQALAPNLKVVAPKATATAPAN